MISCFNLKSNYRALWEYGDDQIKSVDGLRALSFIWIFIFHVFYVYQFFVRPELKSSFISQTDHLFFAWRGTLGVDTFFVISGFLIARILIKEFNLTKTIDLQRFYLRRFLRLMPVYYFSIAVVLIGYDPKISTGFAYNAQHVWTNLVYVNNFLPYEDQFMLWTWSLAIEEQFYILFALIAPFFFAHFRKGLLLLSALLMASFGIRWVLLGDVSSVLINPLLLDTELPYFDSIYDKLYGRFGAILAGILVAMVTTRFPGKVLTASQLHILQIGSVVGIIVLIFYNPESIPTWYMVSFRNVFSILIALVLYTQLNLSQSRTRFFSVLRLRIFKPIAHLSYSGYIWHPICISVIYAFMLNPDQLADNLDLFSPAIVAFITTMAVSTITYLFIERPFMNMRKYLR